MCSTTPCPAAPDRDRNRSTRSDPIPGGTPATIAFTPTGHCRKIGGAGRCGGPDAGAPGRRVVAPAGHPAAAVITKGTAAPPTMTLPAPEPAAP
jgi:hypothetical protein